MSAESVESDPYGIIPPEFVERFAEAETLREALKEAEREPSTTPRGLRDRCPSCGDTRIRQKLGSISRQPNRREDGDMKCWSEGCRHHFDEPLPPLIEIATDPRTIDDAAAPTGEEFETIRRALDLPAYEVGDRVGWSCSTIRRVEKGEAVGVDGAVRKAVLDVYRDEWADLFDRPAEMSRLFAYLFGDREETQ